MLHATTELNTSNNLHQLCLKLCLQYYSEMVGTAPEEQLTGKNNAPPTSKDILKENYPDQPVVSIEKRPFKQVPVEPSQEPFIYCNIIIMATVLSLYPDF